jgi:DNA repair protein RecO (recombination protein O)
VAAGLTPELGACASCGGCEHLVAYSPQAGGVVCNVCEAGGFAMLAETHAFMTAALANPLALAPTASARALREAERAIGETVEHHAHLRLRPAALR